MVYTYVHNTHKEESQYVLIYLPVYRSVSPYMYIYVYLCICLFASSIYLILPPYLVQPVLSYSVSDYLSLYTYSQHVRVKTLFCARRHYRWPAEHFRKSTRPVFMCRFSESASGYLTILLPFMTLSQLRLSTYLSIYLSIYLCLVSYYLIFSYLI